MKDFLTYRKEVQEEYRHGNHRLDWIFNGYADIRPFVIDISYSTNRYYFRINHYFSEDPNCLAIHYFNNDWKEKSPFFQEWYLDWLAKIRSGDISFKEWEALCHLKDKYKGVIGK